MRSDGRSIPQIGAGDDSSYQERVGTDVVPVAAPSWFTNLKLANSLVARDAAP